MRSLNCIGRLSLSASDQGKKDNCAAFMLAEGKHLNQPDPVTKHLVLFHISIAWWRQSHHYIIIILSIYLVLSSVPNHIYYLVVILTTALQGISI